MAGPVLGLPVLLLVVVLAVAITGQGAYYGSVQAIVALGLVAALVASLRASGWSRDDLRVAPLSACCALLAWALTSGAVNGDLPAARGYVAGVGALAVVVVVSHRASELQREALVDAAIALAVLAALLGWIGVAWRVEPWALDVQGAWRAGTTLTYANAAAALFVPVGLLALSRLAARRRSPILVLAAYLLLVGAGTTLSRGGALALVVGVVILAFLLGLRRLLAAAAGPAIGAVIALAGLAPSMPASSQPRPAIAALALLLGGAIAAGSSRLHRRGVVAGMLVAAVIATVAVAVGPERGAIARVAEVRLTLAAPDRTGAGGTALRLAGEAPLTGVGPGQARLTWRGRNGEPLISKYAHNEYLQVAAELGWVGLALLVGLIGTVAAATWGARSALSPELWAGAAAALVAVAVHSGFDFLWHIPAVLVMCGLLIGLASPRARPAATSPQGCSDRAINPNRRGSVVT